MIEDDFASLKRGLADAAEYQKGARAGYVTHEPIDVAAVRKSTGKKQTEFAEAFHLPLGTLRDWEQKRRQPDAPARALLAMIQKDPIAVERLLAAEAS